MCCLVGNWHFVFTNYSFSIAAEHSSSVVKQCVGSFYKKGEMLLGNFLYSVCKLGMWSYISGTSL